MNHFATGFHSLSSIVAVIFALFVLGFIQANADDSVTTEAVNCPRIVSRLGWGAEKPKSKVAFPYLPESVMICQSVTSECNNLADCSSKIRAIQAYHKNEKHWDDIGYNFMIGGDGAVYEGLGWDLKGVHSKSISIAFIGDFTDHLPNEAALNAAKNLIKCSVIKGKISEGYMLFEHKQATATNSQGDKLSDEISTWENWSPGQY